MALSARQASNRKRGNLNCCVSRFDLSFFGRSSFLPLLQWTGCSTLCPAPRYARKVTQRHLKLLQPDSHVYLTATSGMFPCAVVYLWLGNC